LGGGSGGEREEETTEINFFLSCPNFSPLSIHFSALFSELQEQFQFCHMALQDELDELVKNGLS
jgi:hypothetical protein